MSTCPISGIPRLCPWTASESIVQLLFDFYKNHSITALKSIYTTILITSTRGLKIQQQFRKKQTTKFENTFLSFSSQTIVSSVPKGQQMSPEIEFFFCMICPVIGRRCSNRTFDKREHPPENFERSFDLFFNRVWRHWIERVMMIVELSYLDFDLLVKL